MERDEVRRLVPIREPDSHKGTYGHVLVMAGSRGKTGAAILASRAAIRSGAGLVTLAAARSLNDILATALVEVMTEPLPSNAAEEIQPLGDEAWRRLLERKDALLFGPGIGVNDATRSMLLWLLRNLDTPWVIDADGLNNLALEVDRLRSAKTPPILTPHPGEMARLIAKDTATVNQKRVEVARSFAMEHGCHVVLKGARTVIATAEGKVFINSTGNPGMATGGMGDVLAGILTALLGQGFSRRRCDEARGLSPRIRGGSCGGEKGSDWSHRIGYYRRAAVGNARSVDTGPLEAAGKLSKSRNLVENILVVLVGLMT